MTGIRIGPATDYGGRMRVYRERLGVPAAWWLITSACVLLLGTMLWTVLPVALGIASYVVLGAASAALLHFWGATAVEVTDSALRAGSQVLPLSAIGEVAAMDVAQTRALRGPRANPSAYLLVRPYLPESVYVEIAGRPPRRPYWLIGTRNPAGLTAAIEQARRRVRDDRPCDDAHGDRAGGPSPAPADEGAGGGEREGTVPRKESNAW